MSYIKKGIKTGVKIHCLETNKFKTNLMAVFITVPLSRGTVTFDSVIPAVLKRGTSNLKSQEDISKKLEEIYGATFDCGIEKTGDNHVLKFYLEALNSKFIPENSGNILKIQIDLLLDIILNPLIEDNRFKVEYVEAEKKNVKLLIESKIDNKDRYSLNRCIEEMYKGKAYGLYKYGYIEDLDNINARNLYEYYLELINKSKIDIFISGEINSNDVIKLISENENIQKLKERDPKYIINNEQTEIKESKDEDIITDKLDVTQGKLVIGLDVNSNEYNSRFKICLYNILLGGTSTSKLFQNVREKASLAYSASSNYVIQKNNIYIRCGIEIKNFDKTVKIIREQLISMQNGEFTEEELKNAKNYVISGIHSAQDEQDSEIVYYIGQELAGKLTTFEQYEREIERVSLADIKKIANEVKINTIYFLRN